MSKYRLNVVLSLMFISLIINVCVAQAEHPLLDIPYDINLVDKEENINLNKFDTVNIDLPYVNIINKKLKEAIDNSDFVIRSHRDSIDPICTYLKKTGKDISDYEILNVDPVLILDLKNIYRDKVRKSPKMMQTHSKKK